jgi:hypothetical protein
VILRERRDVEDVWAESAALIGAVDFFPVARFVSSNFLSAIVTHPEL